jgi:GLPGLI family protein
MMTKLINSCLLSLFFVLFISTLQAQNSPFTGTIVYDITTDASASQMNRNMMPTYMIYRFSTDKESMTMNFAMTQQRTIFDASTQIAKVLLDFGGKKVAIRQTAAEIQALRNKQGQTVSVKEMKETKTIAGYLCKKVILTKKMMDGKEVPSTVYYTDALDISKFKSFNSFPEIKGVPLEFSMKNGDKEFKVIARTIIKETIPPAEFSVSPDYKETSAGELSKIFGGKGIR